jgi:hypothetical protein
MDKVELREISMARDALQLAPGLATGLAIGADIPSSEPAVIGAIGSRTEMRAGVDGASASSGEGEERRWRAGGLGTSLGALLTRFT